MPPQARHTKDEILEAAYAILRREGRQALTARRLGDELGSSSRPIFTVFSGMQEVQAGALELAKAEYTGYLDRGLAEVPPFKGAGMEHVRFAIREPQLFREIFMSPDNAGWGGPPFFLQSAENYARVLRSLTDFYGLAPEAANALYGHLWVYTHGIASLIATGVLKPDEGAVSRQLTEVFSALLPRYQKGEQA